MIASKQIYSIGVHDFVHSQQQECFNGMVPSIHVVSQEEVLLLRELPSLIGIQLPILISFSKS